jgi:hypothetical protein
MRSNRPSQVGSPPKASFIDGGEEYDVREYEDLLLRSAADLLVPFGWSFEALRRRADEEDR